MELRNSSSNLQRLLEQTAFLLDKQRESKTLCVAEFSAVIDLVTKDIALWSAKGNNPEKVEQLKKVLEIVEKQKETFEADVDGDIAFLEEQFSGISEACNESTQQEQNELYEALMGDETLIPTEEFKRSVLEEANASYEGFKSIINDLKGVLVEGDVQELLEYLENMEPGSEHDEMHDEGADHDSEEECCSEEGEDECSSGSEKSDSSCCQGRSSCGSKCVCSDTCGC